MIKNHPSLASGVATTLSVTWVGAVFNGEQVLSFGEAEANTFPQYLLPFGSKMTSWIKW
jgi:hypothetical protein